MKISTKGRYALRVMVDLAENADGKFVAMKEVAARQDISLKYLEKILPVLVKEKLIEGVHGKGGGYRLTRNPEEYNIGEILRLTEGELGLNSCLGCKTEEVCDRSENCRTLPMWSKLSGMINEYFDSITIADLMKTEDMKEELMN